MPEPIASARIEALENTISSMNAALEEIKKRLSAAENDKVAPNRNEPAPSANGDKVAKLLYLHTVRDAVRRLVDSDAYWRETTPDTIDNIVKHVQNVPQFQDYDERKIRIDAQTFINRRRMDRKRAEKRLHGRLNRQKRGAQQNELNVETNDELIDSTNSLPEETPPRGNAEVHDPAGASRHRSQLLPIRWRPSG